MKNILYTFSLLLISVSIYCQDSYHSALQNTFQTTYNLPVGTWIFDDNESAILTNAGGYNGIYAIQESVDTDFSQLVKATISTAGANAWDAGWSVRNKEQLDKGDKVLIVFSIRSIGSTGKVSIFAENSTTYAKEVFLAVDIAKGWTQYFVPFEVTNNYNPNTITFGFHLAHQAQELEIGGYTAINFGKDVDLSMLPNEVNNDKYDGYQADAPWRAVAADNIDRLRKANLNLQVQNSMGTAVPNAKIDVKMLQHDFAFGSAITADKIAGNNAHNIIYENKIINLDGEGHGFNWVVFENDMKWPAWESNWLVTEAELVNAVQWLKAKDITIRGHNLVWPGNNNMPRDIDDNKTNIPYIKERIDGHLETILNYPGLKGAIEEWDVLNEITTNRSLENYFRGQEGYTTGREILAEIFKKAREEDPNTGLWLNDYITISSNAKPGNANYDNLKLFTRELIEAGVDLEGLGFQGHIGGFPNGIPSVLETLDDFYDEFGLKAKITEFDMPSFVEEGVAAQYLKDFMTAIFGHESMDGFLFWNFWDGSTWLNEGTNMFRRDWSRTPAGDAFIELVFKEWWTDESLLTAANGQIDTRVFKGLYEISYESDGVLIRDTIRITEDTNTTIIADNITTATKEVENQAPLAVIYPNPVDSHIIIKKTIPGQMTVRLLNMAGQVLQEQWTEAAETDLYVAHLKGLFIVEVKSEEAVLSQIVVIE